MGLASHDNLDSHTERACPAEFGAEMLPECHASITRWRYEQVGRWRAFQRLATHDNLNLEVTQGSSSPARMPSRIRPTECLVPCREVARALPTSGDLDSVESLAGGRVAPHACKSVHAGRWKAPGTRDDGLRP